MSPAQRLQHRDDSPLGFRGGLLVLERVLEIRPGAVQLFPPAGQSAERKQPLAQVVDQGDLGSKPACQRLDRLHRAGVGARVDGGHRFVGKPIGQPLGVTATGLGKRPVVLLVTGIGRRHRLRVAHQHDHLLAASTSSAFCLISSTTAGSRRVVVSPSWWPSAMSRSSRRMILPERVLGRSLTMITALGRAILPIFSPIQSRSSAASWSLGSYPDRSSTKQSGVWPVSGSGAAVAAASATAGCSTSADSSSIVESRCPDTFITSSIRPRSQKQPSSSTRAPSPAKYVSGPKRSK